MTKNHSQSNFYGWQDIHDTHEIFKDNKIDLICFLIIVRGVILYDSSLHIIIN